jgi:hypothetical protein
MTEEQKIILYVSLLVISLIILIIIFLYTKKVIKKENETINKLEEETYKYFESLSLLKNEYFPYFYSHASGIRWTRGSLGDKDNITNLIIGKNRKFYFDRILYIINDQINYPFTKEIIDEKEYIKIDNKINTIEMLISFEKPSHFIIKYKVSNIGENKYKIELIKEMNEDDGRRNGNN